MNENLDNNLNLDTENDIKSNQIPKTFRQELLDFLKDLIVIVGIVLIVRTFIILPFQISGQSMYDSYYDKEFIIVDRFSYNFLSEPKRGDVIVFDTHIPGKEYFIKRIVGLPGETLKIVSGKVYIKTVGSNDFIQLDEKYLSETNYNATYVRGDASEFLYEVPSGSYFVMGDNRNASTDSRVCFSSCQISGKSNFISKKDITGKILVDLGYFNFKAFGYTNPDLGIDTKPKWFSSPSSYEYSK
ncbi:MAG: signal peptidase I [Candidatus Gracilibacteria bacterium]|nr:signal peptidase I [Candidatus Gracilibacteria bacterium]